MKKRIIAISLVIVMGIVFLAGCTDSSQDSVIQEVDYDPVAEVANYQLGELTEAERDYVVEMGYNDCDHMVAALIGEHAGIYEALGLNINITKTPKIAEAMSSGEMDVGYHSINVGVRAANEGAPLFMAAANHLGGSRYLVVSNDIETPDDLVGNSISVAARAEITNPEWIRWANELKIPVDTTNYEAVQMSQADSLFALRSGQIDAITVCDPYASQAEFEEFGRIVGTGWGAHEPDDPTSDWGMCCIYIMNEDLKENYPEIASRLVLAHSLSIKYLYEHPYNSGLIFAEGFGVDKEIGLRTVYMKTVAEGRTITWEFDETNLENFMQYYYTYDIPEEEIPNIEDINTFMSTDLLESSGIEDFQTFMNESNIDEEFPIGMTYEEWMEKAMARDGIEGDAVTEIPDIWASNN